MGDEINRIKEIQRKLSVKEALSESEKQTIDFMRKLQANQELSQDQKKTLLQKHLATNAEPMKEALVYKSPREIAREANLDRLSESQREFSEGRTKLTHADVPKKDIVTEQMKKLEDLRANPIKEESLRPILTGDTFKENIASKTIPEKVPSNVLDYGKMKKEMSLAKKAGKGLKALPIIGSLIAGASALSTGDASAAVPILQEADDLGPEKGSLEYKFETGEKLTPEEMEELKSIGRFSQLRKTIK